MGVQTLGKEELKRDRVGVNQKGYVGRRGVGWYVDHHHLGLTIVYATPFTPCLLKVRKFIKSKEEHDHAAAKSSAVPDKLQPMLLAGVEHGGLPAFLVGSMLFAFSAATGSAELAKTSSEVGLGLFLLGRVLFLEASQTDLCDVLFRTNWRFNMLTQQWKQADPHWAFAIGYGKDFDSVYQDRGKHATVN